MTIPSATDETGASFLQSLYMDTPSNPPLIMSSNNSSRNEVNGVDGHEEVDQDATDPNLGESATTFYYDGTIVSPVLTTPIPHDDDDGLLSRQERKDPPGSHDHERSPDSLEEELMATLRKMDRKLAAGSDPASSGRLLSKSPRTGGTLKSQSKSTSESGGNRNARHGHHPRKSKNDSKCKPRKSKSTGDCTVQRLATTSVVVATTLPPSSAHSSIPATSMSTVSSTTAKDHDDPTAPLSLSSSSHRSYRPHTDEPQSILSSTMTVSSGEFDAILGLGIKPPFGNDDDDDDDDVDGCDEDEDKEEPAKPDGRVTVGTEPSADRFKETSMGASTSGIATNGTVVHKEEEEEQSPPVNPQLLQKRIKQSRRGASRTASLRRTKSDGPRHGDGRRIGSGSHHHVNSNISSHNKKDVVGTDTRHKVSPKTLWEIKILFQTEHPGSPLPNDDELKTRYKNSGDDATTRRPTSSTSSPSSTRLRRHMPATSSYVVNVPQQENGGIVTTDDITIAIGRKCPRPSSLHDLLDKNRWARQENLGGTSFRSLQSSSSTSHIHNERDKLVGAVEDAVAETNGKTVTCRRRIILKEGINSSSDEVVVTRNIYHNDNRCQSNIASTNNVPFPYMMTFSKFEGEREEDSQQQPTRPPRHSSTHDNVEPRTLGRHPYSDHDVRINSSTESSLEKKDDKESDDIEETIDDGEDDDEDVPDFADDDDEPDEADPLIPHSSMTDLLSPPLSDVQNGNGDNNVEMNAYDDVNESKNNVPEQHSASPRRLTLKKFRSLFKVASPKYNHLDSATESFILDDKDIEGVHKVIGNSDIPNGIEQNVALPPPLDDSVWRLEPDSGQNSLPVSPRRKKGSMQIGAKKSRLSSALRHLHQILGEEMQENKQWGALDDGPSSSSTELQVEKQPDQPDSGTMHLDERKIVESVKPEKRKKRKESKVGEWVELDVSNRSGVSVKINVPPRQRSSSQKHSTRHRSPSVRETGPRSRSVPRKEHKRSSSPTKKSRKSKTVTMDRPRNYDEAMKANKHASDSRRHRARLASRSLSPIQSRRQKSDTKATTTRLGPSREKSTSKRRTGRRNQSHSMYKAKDDRSKNHAASSILPTSRKSPVSGHLDHFKSIQPMEQHTHDEGDSLGVYVTQSLEDLLRKVKSKLKNRASSSLVTVPTPGGADDQIIIAREHNNVAFDNRNNNSSTKQETVQNSLRDAMQW